MLISDQIGMAPSPLIGENIDELGVRFPDMSNIYDRELRTIARNTAKELGIPLQEAFTFSLLAKL
jgi:purine-nucleoside phosphorylase